MIFNAQGPLAGLRGPSSSSSARYSAQYDYGGLEDHLKRQEETSALRNSKFAAMYGGDVASSMAAGSRIRELVDALRVHTPDATERRPVQIVAPLVRKASESTDSNADSKSGELVFGEGPKMDAPDVNAGGGGGGRGGGGGNPPPGPQPEKPQQPPKMAELPAAALPRQIDEDRAGVIHDRRKPKKPQMGDYGEMIA